MVLPSSDSLPKEKVWIARGKRSEFSWMQAISQTPRALRPVRSVISSPAGAHIWGQKLNSLEVLFSTSIEDNGVGISAEMLPLITRYGFSAAQGEVTFGGLGIGIPTAIDSVSELSGDVHYDSNKNRGTIVTLTIPFPQ